MTFWENRYLNNEEMEREYWEGVIIRFKRKHPEEYEEWERQKQKEQLQKQKEQKRKNTYFSSNEEKVSLSSEEIRENEIRDSNPLLLSTVARNKIRDRIILLKGLRKLFSELKNKGYDYDLANIYIGIYCDKGDYEINFPLYKLNDGRFIFGSKIKYNEEVLSEEYIWHRPLLIPYHLARIEEDVKKLLIGLNNVNYDDMMEQYVMRENNHKKAYELNKESRYIPYLISDTRFIEWIIKYMGCYMDRYYKHDQKFYEPQDRSYMPFFTI